MELSDEYDTRVSPRQCLNQTCRMTVPDLEILAQVHSVQPGSYQELKNGIEGMKRG